MARKIPQPQGGIKDQTVATWIAQALPVLQINDDEAGAAYIPSYTMATLPKALLPSRLIIVRDATGGPTFCINDGSVWRVVALISSLTQVA